MENKYPPGQGHGKQGRFAGLPDPYGEEHFAKIVVLPVPFDKTTTYQKGSDKGPEALIEASRNLELYDIETDSEVYLNGIYTSQPISKETSQEMLESAYQRTKEFLNQGKFVVVIGGEHSITYAPVRAHAEHFKCIDVLQFDAHADLQPSYEGNPWSHAAVMARVKEIPEVNKIISVGIRSMAVEEKVNYDASNTFCAHTLFENDAWMDEVVDRIVNPVYITFDLDCFDPSLMPSTGTPEPGGLQWHQVAKLLLKVARQKKIIGFDVVELCPTPTNLSPDFVAAKLIYKLLGYIFSHRKKDEK